MKVNAHETTLGGRVTVFRKPVPGRTYAIGIDTASGKSNSNDTSATVLCVNDGRQDAICAGSITPDDMGVIAESLGYYYNEATLAVENEKHGVTVISYLLKREYPKIYIHPIKLASATGKAANEFGWDPTRNRQTAIDWLQTDIGYAISTMEEERKKAVYVFDATTITQLGFFVQNKKTGKYQAAGGQKDDRVSSLYIANFVRRELYADIFRPPPLPEPEKTFLDKLMEQSQMDKRDDRGMGPREL